MLMAMIAPKPMPSDGSHPVHRDVFQRPFLFDRSGRVEVQHERFEQRADDADRRKPVARRVVRRRRREPAP